MASLTEDEKKLFPLKTVKSVVSLFRSIITRTREPDLAVLSIIAGYIENTLTCTSHGPCAKLEAAPNTYSTAGQDAEDFPPLELRTLESLAETFKSLITSSVDGLEVRTTGTREVIKRVSDIIWNTLTRSYYKDRAHLQNLYSYLTENKLDCFGVALAVTIGCQVLGLVDVHLALAEDHAWVVFGENGVETVEVTWHGKGNEDRRGQPVDAGIQAKSWLYVAGKPVVGSRYLEVAAIVSSMNPSISATADSMEVTALQQSLLWLLYDMGHLSRFPMALGNLADLEELSPTTSRPPCSQLFGRATEVARKFYDNCHVYPYTYQGGYFYRNRLFKEAFESWANAADVIRKYNYSREDEEIYKEFLEIANELIPHVMKVEGSGHSPHCILKDPECFAFLLRFYDGICQWEEGSTTPVLHIGWAKPLVNTISKFDAEVRSHVTIECSDAHDDCTDISVSPEEKPGQDDLELEYKDANANDVLLDWRQDSIQSSAENPASSLASVDLAALTDLCGRTLLSPAFFLGKQPCVLGVAARTAVRQHHFSSYRPRESTRTATQQQQQQQKPRLRLRSQKMAGLKDLLLAEKLNTQAISLQLTAQSQVQLGGRKLREDLKEPRIEKEALKDNISSRPKRQRKE